MKLIISAVICLAVSFAQIHPALAQTATVHSSQADPLQALDFLKGTWDTVTGRGSANAHVTGTYTFQRELRNHILARHIVAIESCKGPTDFDCQHGDLFYVYQDGENSSLKAIFFDNEGHVIHYSVSTPSSTRAVFLSDATQSGPQFRLIYQRTGDVLSGMFQIRMPGQDEWKSYLEWSGGKHAQ